MRRERAGLLLAMALSVLASRCMLGGGEFDDLQPIGPPGASGVSGSGSDAAGSAGSGGGGAGPGGSAGGSGDGGMAAAGGSMGSGIGDPDSGDGSSEPDVSVDSGTGGVDGAPEVDASFDADAGSDGPMGQGGTDGGSACTKAACPPRDDLEFWSDYACGRDETCLLGDVNGDGKDDVLAFVRDTRTGEAENDVFVSLTNQDGTALEASTKWSDSFCVKGESCAVADVDGDGREDLVAFVQGSQPDAGADDVFVALSTGSAFGERKKWADEFCWAGMECFAADVNADRKADLIGFVKSTRPAVMGPQVLVALSTGNAFGQPDMWGAYHCVGTEKCAVGDVNGDGRADAVAFHQDHDQTGNYSVWVRLALPEGGFTDSFYWSDYFCLKGEQCAVADVTGDGRADLVAFSQFSNAWQGASSPNGWFESGNMLADGLCAPGEVCLVGDMTGDGVSDLVTLIRGNDPNRASDAYVLRLWGSAWRWMPDAPNVMASSATLLRSDQILVTGGGQNNCCRNGERADWGFDHTYLHHPASDDWTRVDSPYGATKDAFHAGHSHDNLGRLVYYGGTLGLATDRGMGIPESARFDPSTGKWTALSSTAAFWFPTLVPGQRTGGEWNLYLLSGGNYDIPRVPHTPLVHRLGAGDTSWTATGTTLATYDPRPRAFLLPNGKIFMASPADPDRKNYFYDPTSDQISPAGDDPVPNGAAYESFVNPAVLLPIQADAQKQYSSVRVMHIGGGRSYIKELGGSEVGPWHQPASMVSRDLTTAANRDYANATLLPTGQVLVTGGQHQDGDNSLAWQSQLFGEDTGGATLTDKWFKSSGSPIRRQRHSVALLLRDGRVWIAGSSVTGAGSYCESAQSCSSSGKDDRTLSVSLFEPWYYGRADRPVITACPESFSGGASTRDLTIGNAEGESITKVALMAPGSVTGSFDSNQRLIWLDIVAKSASTVTVNIPYNDAVAPPGDYMVFVLKRNAKAGAPAIPSIGCWTKR